MKTFRLAILILLAALPIGAQQYTTCNLTPGTPGQIVCQSGPPTSGKRIAIVAGVAAAGTVIVLAIRYHKRHKDHPPTHTRGAERR